MHNKSEAIATIVKLNKKNKFLFSITLIITQPEVFLNGRLFGDDFVYMVVIRTRFIKNEL